MKIKIGIRKKKTVQVSVVSKHKVQVAPPKERKDWTDYLELEDDKVYGICCYGRNQFGTEVCPAMGSEIKRRGSSIFEYGAVRFGKDSALPRFTYSERHLVRKFFRVRAIDGTFFAAELYQGNYEPPKQQVTFVIKKKFSAKPKPTRNVRIRIKR